MSLAMSGGLRSDWMKPALTGTTAGQTLGWTTLQYSTLSASEYSAPHWLWLYRAHRPEYDPGEHGAAAVACLQACTPLPPPGARSQHCRHSQPHCGAAANVSACATWTP